MDAVWCLRVDDDLHLRCGDVTDASVESEEVAALLLLGGVAGEGDAAAHAPRVLVVQGARKEVYMQGA